MPRDAPLGGISKYDVVVKSRRIEASANQIAIPSFKVFIPESYSRAETSLKYQPAPIGSPYYGFHFEILSSHDFYFEITFSNVPQPL